MLVRLKSWRCSSTRGNAAMEQHRTPSRPHPTPPCTTSTLQPWWASTSLGWPSSRSPCPCPPAALCPLPNSWRALLAAAWRIWDTATPPSPIWGAPVEHNVWTRPHPLAAPPQCLPSSVHSAHHRTPPLESLLAAPSLRLLITPTCCHPHWEEMAAVTLTPRAITEHAACSRYDILLKCSLVESDSLSKIIISSDKTPWLKNFLNCHLPPPAHTHISNNHRVRPLRTLTASPSRYQAQLNLRLQWQVFLD